MDIGLTLLLGGVVMLLIGSAFFSGSETALMSSSKPKLHSLEKEGHAKAKWVSKLIENPEKLLSTILLGNNLVNIGASALMTGLFIKLFGEAGIAYATFVMTFVVLIFAEIVPKTLASRKPEDYAMLVSVPMRALMWVSTPFTKFIRIFSGGILRLFGINLNEELSNFGEEDVRGAIGMGLKEGVLAQRQHRMLDSIFDLGEITVDNIMVHRSNMQTLDVGLSADAIFVELAENTHTRIPMWKDTPDNIVGILHAKDFYQAHRHALLQGKKLNVEEIIHPPYFIPETAVIGEQLMEFRNRRRHMAIVVDEYGDIQGIVTLEDILEEIVGEIEDEHDAITPGYVQENDGSITISAHFAVRDANRKFGWDLPEDDAVTLAGLLIESAGHIPSVGEKVDIEGRTFKVISKKRQALLKLNTNPRKK